MTQLVKEKTLPIPRKLNQGMITALSKAIANGNYPSVACQLCGIDWHTLQRWVNLGDEELSRDEPDTENIYLRLSTAIKRAESESEALMVEVVRRAATEKKEWVPAMTYLERRHPDRWGRKDRTRVDINERKAITITHVEVVLDRGDGKEIIEGESRELKEGEYAIQGQGKEETGQSGLNEKEA